ncbi:MAG: TlpA disulfide reductase family protein [Planctomycetota bacterium]
MQPRPFRSSRAPLGACLALALLAGTPTAAAQLAPEPTADQPVRDQAAVAVLEASAEALGNLTHLSFRIDRTMEVTDELDPKNAMLTSVKINARGAYRGTKLDPNSAEEGWVYRLEGFADNIGQPDAFELTVVREPNVVTWLDPDEETLHTARPVLARGNYVSADDNLGGQFLYAKSPWQIERMVGTSLQLLGPVEIDGVTCDVVLVEYPQRLRTLPHRFAIGREDGIPRRITRILVPGYEDIARITEIDAATGVDRASLAIDAPAGWATVYAPASLDPDAQPNDPTVPQGPAFASPGATVGGQVGDVIPAFEASTMLGEPVSSETLVGKPGVLVFWTSWVPDTQPLLADLATLQSELDAGTNLVTFTVRERNPDNAFNMLAAAGLDDITLVTNNGQGAVVGMDVLRTPTVFVINADGKVVYRSGDRYEAETTLGEIRAALESIGGE